MPSLGGARPIAQLAHVSKWYDQGAIRTTVLADASLTIHEGEFVAILGPSGSGKTTLLNIMGAMDAASGGSVVVAGVDLSRSTPAEATAIRRDKIGFIFQFYNLFPTFTVGENVQAALDVLNLPRAEVRRRTEHYLSAVGLGEKVAAFPSQLSGGQQQRVAIARALAKEPRLVLADEPTGNLDHVTGEQVVTLMRTLNRETGAAFVVVTHNTEIAAVSDRVVHIQDGRVAAD